MLSCVGLAGLLQVQQQMAVCAHQLPVSAVRRCVITPVRWPQRGTAEWAFLLNLASSHTENNHRSRANVPVEQRRRSLTRSQPSASFYLRLPGQRVNIVDFGIRFFFRFYIFMVLSPFLPVEMWMSGQANNGHFYLLFFLFDCLYTGPLTFLQAENALLLPSAQFGCLMSNQGVITGTTTGAAFISKGSLAWASSPSVSWKSRRGRRNWPV